MSRKIRSCPAKAVALLSLFLTTCCWAASADAHCTAFIAASLPFFTCNHETGGFIVSVGAQRSIVARQLEPLDDVPLVVSTAYAKGVRVGAWAASVDFVVIIKSDGTGPHRDRLIAEFCSSVPLLVVFLDGRGRLQHCGEWLTLIEGSAPPIQ